VSDPNPNPNPNPKPPVFNLDADPTSRWWLYAWGQLPTDLPGLRVWLTQHGMTPGRFKQTARYQANLDTYPWLKDL
jgi:hypothetical protein